MAKFFLQNATQIKQMGQICYDGVEVNSLLNQLIITDHDNQRSLSSTEQMLREVRPLQTLRASCSSDRC